MSNFNLLILVVIVVNIVAGSASGQFADKSSCQLADQPISELIVALSANVELAVDVERRSADAATKAPTTDHQQPAADSPPAETPPAAASAKAVPTHANAQQQQRRVTLDDAQQAQQRRRAQQQRRSVRRSDDQRRRGHEQQREQRLAGVRIPNHETAFHRRPPRHRAEQSRARTQTYSDKATTW